VSRIIEILYHGLIAFLRAIGLSKRPLPEPPKIPAPKPDTPPKPGKGHARFYGPFIPQWNSFETREAVLFDFRYQVHGCGKTAREYGIKDPIENGVRFSLTVSEVETNEINPVYDVNKTPIGDRGVCVDRLYWIPGHILDNPPFWFHPKRAHVRCGTTQPQPTPSPKPAGTQYYLKLMVQHPNGQEWFWTEEVTVVKSGCS